MGGQPVIANTGCVWTATKTGTIQLAAGTSVVRLTYTDDGWPGAVILRYRGPDTGGQPKLVSWPVGTSCSGGNP